MNLAKNGNLTLSNPLLSLAAEIDTGTQMEWPLDLDLNESASGPPLELLLQVVFVVCPASPNT